MMNRMSNFRSEIGETKCKIYFPGFSHDDFDRNGCISAWKMSKYFEGGRLIGFGDGFLRNYFSISKTAIVFLIAQHIQLKPMSIRRKTCPFSISSELKEIGASSYVARQEFRNENDQTLIGTCDFKCVHVNSETKRPEPLAKKQRQSFAQLIENVEPIQPVFPERIPDLPFKTFHIPIFILHNDTDRNQHLNQSQFLRYCLDCAAMASTEGKYDYFMEDICNYQAVDIVMLYKREGLAGDLVHVHTWQDKHKPQELHFVITKDKNSMLYAKITFALEPISKL